MLAGSLTEFGLADVFSLLAATRKTGVLNLESPDSRGRVWIASGGICYAVADVTRSPLAARLLHAGQVNGNQAEEIIAAQASGAAAAVADTLSAFGLTTEEIRGLVRDQIIDAVFELSSWGDGTFAFDQGDTTDVVPVAVAEEVLAEVGTRLDGWDEITAGLPDPTAVLSLVTRPSGLEDGVTVDLAHWGVLTLVDGLRPIAEVIDLSGHGRHMVSRVLGELLAAGLVEVRDAATGETATQERHRILTTAEGHLLGARQTQAAVAPVAAPAPAPEAEPQAVEVAAVRSHDVAPEAHVAQEPASRGLLPDEPVADAPVAEDQGVGDQGVGDQSPESQGPEDQGVQEPVAGDQAVQEPAEEPAHQGDVHGSGLPHAGLSPDELRQQALAELGLVGTGASTGEQPAPVMPRRLSRDRAVGADLVGRLIDGVGGG